MDLSDVARDLLMLVGAEQTEANVDGVMTVFQGIVQGVNNNWEEHIAEETDECLAISKVVCKGCKAPITVRRERNMVKVGVQ